MPLDKKIHSYLSGNPIVGSTGCGNRPKHGTLLDLPLDKAIPTLRAREEAYAMKTDNSCSSSEEMITDRRAPIPKIRLRKIGPFGYSMERKGNGDKDEIIFTTPTVSLEKKKEERISAESSDQSQKTASAAGNQTPTLEYPKCTPYRAIGHLVDKGMPIKMQIGKLKNFVVHTDQSHKWRCVIYFGNIHVMVDSIRKQVARDMASVKFLERLDEMDKRCKIPKYTILPEIFIDPRIFHMLEKEAKQKRLYVTNWMIAKPVKMTNRKDGDFVAYLYVATYIVGKAIYRGESFVQEYAKVLAAKTAYEGLTKTEVAPTKYFSGGLCDPTWEYDFGDCEVLQGISFKSLKDEIREETQKGTLKAMYKKARL